MANSERLDVVLNALRHGGQPTEGLRLGRELPGLLIELGAPDYLVRLLQDIHSATWMTIGAHGFLQTHKGNRPGSPLADAKIHFIMYDVSSRIHDFLEAAGHLAVIRTMFDMDIGMVIWPSLLWPRMVLILIPALLSLLDHVRDLFLRRGFLLNMSKGKTGVVATYFVAVQHHTA